MDSPGLTAGRLALETLYADWRRWLVEHRPTVAALQGDAAGLGRLDGAFLAAGAGAAEAESLGRLETRLAALLPGAKVDPDPLTPLLARTLAQRLAWSRLDPAVTRRDARPDHALDWAAEGLDLILGFAGLSRARRTVLTRAWLADVLAVVRGWTVRLDTRTLSAHDRKMADWAAGDLLSFFSDHGAPLLPSGEGQAAVATLRTALRGLRSRLRVQTPTPDGFRCGEETLSRYLREVEHVSTPPAELLRQALVDLPQHMDAVAAAAARLYPRRSVRSALAELESDHGTARQLVRDARACVGELREFTLRAGFVTVPEVAEDPACRVASAPAYLRALAVACLDVPGPWQTRPQSACFYLAAPLPGDTPVEVETALRTFHRSKLAWIAGHETYPGHLVEHQHRRRAAHEAFQVADSEVFIEGWACYAEGLLVEHGFRDGDPRIVLGVAWARVLRHVRMIAALQLHAGDVPLREVDRLFRRAVNLSPVDARRETYRAACEPTVLTYALGRAEIERLRREAERRAGFTQRGFHDELLGWGTLPFGLRGVASADV